MTLTSQTYFLIVAAFTLYLTLQKCFPSFFSFVFIAMAQRST